VGRTSMVDLRRNTSTKQLSKGQAALKYHDASSANSAVGQFKGNSGMEAPKANAAVRKPPGVCTETDPRKLWFCETCNSTITNTSICIRQHYDTGTHGRNRTAWGEKSFKAFDCHLCAASFQNDPNKVRAHFRSQHPDPVSQQNTDAALPSQALPASPLQSATPKLVSQEHTNTALPSQNHSATVHRHHCETCNIHMASDPTTIHSHNSSHSHRSMVMMRRDSDNRPDGSGLASRAAAANEDKIWITVTKKNGDVVNKLVKRGNTGRKTGLGLGADSHSNCDGGESCSCQACIDARANAVDVSKKRQKVCKSWV
jgi:hypothetical protein